MKIEKKIGIYLDHSLAQFVNYHDNSDNLEIKNYLSICYKKL